MDDRFMFEIKYEEAVLKSAVRQYMFRAIILEHPWVIAIGFSGAIFWAIATIVDRDFTFVTGLFLGVMLAELAFLGFIGWSHWRGMREKLRTMTNPQAAVHLGDDDIAIEADTGSTRVKWTTIKDVWRLKKVWLLMLARNQFITLPLVGVPGDALAFITAKVARRPF